MSTCTFEHSYRDFDGSNASMQCGAVATHFPVLDDAYSQYLRETGDPSGEAPAPVPFCEEHHAALLIEVAAQSADDPHRFWIVQEVSA